MCGDLEREKKSKHPRDIMQFWATVKKQKTSFLSQKYIGGLAEGRKDLPLSLSLFLSI